MESVRLLPDRHDRIQFLIDVADRFRPVGHDVAAPPYPCEARVPACESEAYVFSTENPDGTLTYHFAVENPHGISAKALAVVLAETCSGERPERVAAMSRDFVLELFGGELSMGKSMGLLAMVSAVRGHARRAVEARD